MHRLVLQFVVAFVSVIPAELVFAQAPAAKPSHADLEKYAATAFGQVQLSTDAFVVSPEFKAAGFKLELRGKQIRQAKQLFDAKDWLGLFNINTGNPVTEYPSKRDINDAIESMKTHECFIYIMTGKAKPQDVTQGKEIAIVSVVRDPDNRGMTPTFYVDYDVASDEHPDGNGFIVDWRPKRGQTYVAYGREASLEKFRRIPNEVHAEVTRLSQKHRLGEFTDQEHRDAIAKLADETEAKLTVMITGKK